MFLRPHFCQVPGRFRPPMHLRFATKKERKWHRPWLCLSLGMFWGIEWRVIMPPPRFRQSFRPCHKSCNATNSTVWSPDPICCVTLSCVTFLLSFALTSALLAPVPACAGISSVTRKQHLPHLGADTQFNLTALIYAPTKSKRQRKPFGS